VASLCRTKGIEQPYSMNVRVTSNFLSGFCLEKEIAHGILKHTILLVIVLV